MKNFKRIAAIIAIVLLGGMYLACLICAIIGTESAKLLFRMALGATIAVPIVLYGLLVLMKVFPFAKKEPAPRHAEDAEPLPGEDPELQGEEDAEFPSREGADSQPEGKAEDAGADPQS